MTEERHEETRAQIYQLVAERWAHVEDFETVANMVLYRMDMVICGPPGSGKTSFIDEMVKVHEIMPFRVNCIEHYNTTKLLRRLGKIFKEDLGLGSKMNCSSLDRIIYSLNYEPEILEKSEILQIENAEERKVQENKRLKEEKKRNMIKKFAVVLENFNVFLKQRDGPQAALKLYKTLKIFKRHINFPFSFIFATSCACDLPIAKILIPYPNNEVLMDFVKDCVIDSVELHFRRLGKKLVKNHQMEKLKLVAVENELLKPENKNKTEVDIDERWKLVKARELFRERKKEIFEEAKGVQRIINRLLPPKNLAKLVNHFASDVVQSFNVISKEYKVFEGISKRLIDFKIEPYSKIIGEKAMREFYDTEIDRGFKSELSDLLDVENFNEGYTSQDYRKCVKIFLNDHKRSYDTLPSIRKIVADASKNILEKNHVMKELEERDFDLPIIPGVILIACFLSSKNPETEDKRIFKTASSKSNKRKKKGEYVYKAPKMPYIERIIFIGQTLLSLVVDVQREENYEILLVNQSLQFYSSFKLLEELNLIKRIHSNIDEFAKPRFDCLCERNFVNRIARNLGLNLDEYSYQ